MTAWRARRHLRRGARVVAPRVAELAHAVADGADARALAHEVTADLLDTTPVGSEVPFDDVVVAVARRCDTDAKRAALAAYLHVVRGVELDRLDGVFVDVDAAAARRLVERGTGSAPVTSTEACRGWALVVPQSRRTSAEKSAAVGHLSLCRRCRNRLRAHHTLEQRVATAGTATVGASVATAVARSAIAAHAGTGVAGGLSVPAVALSAAAALTAGAGALAATMHLGPHDARSVSHRIDRRDATTGGTTTGASSAPEQRSTAPGAPPTATLPTSAPSVPTATVAPLLPLDGSSVSVPSVPSLPLATPTVQAPLPVPTFQVPLPLPSPTLTLTVSPPALP